MSGINYVYTFTTTIASPDIYFGSVYNALNLVTAHFGVIPIVMTNWNSGTNVATFQTLAAWSFSNYQNNVNLITATDLQAEIQAVSTLYAAERVTIANGGGVHLINTFIENSDACTT